MLTVFQQAVHNHLSEVLKEKYYKNSKAVERISSVLFTKGDVEEFLILVNEIYKTGFERAAESYKDQLLKLGYQVKVSHPKEGL